MTTKLTKYQKNIINDYLKKRLVELEYDKVKRQKHIEVPKVINLVKSKMLRYSAGFIYLFAFITLLANYYMMFIILALLSMGFYVFSIIFDIKFIGDNLK